MAVSVIDLLELVYVQYEKDAGLFLGQQLVDLCLRSTTVINAGQPVGLASLLSISFSSLRLPNPVSYITPPANLL